MLNPDEIKYIEEQIKSAISAIEHEHFQYKMNEQTTDFSEEHPGWMKAWLRMRLRDLFYLLHAYLEAKGMPYLLQTFKSAFSEIIANDNSILEAELAHPEGEQELTVIVGFKQFLEPFKFFDYGQTKEDETKKLTSILKNTGFILKNINSKVSNEADIYKQIKWVLGLYYPSCRRKNKASFIQEFKSYSPDILIPELKTAIEYKHIKSPSNNIDDFLDQIKIDATNYSDDYRYDTFIAVIYIEDIAIATPESIEIAWKAKRFPNNWELVIAGNSKILK